MNFRIEDMDPFPIRSDDDVEKRFQHLFEEGQQVRHKQDGRTGKITAALRGGHFLVHLDSGHDVKVTDADIEPENFPPAEASDAVLQACSKISLADGLCAALKAGLVSDNDRVLIESEIRKYKMGGGAVDPFGFEDSRLNVLKAICRKYFSPEAAMKALMAADANSFTKARKRSTLRASDFKVGQQVRGVDDGAIGRIVKVGQYSLEIEFSTGSGTWLFDRVDLVELVA